MASVKAIMSCIGAETSGSVLRRLFGFRASRVPQDPGAATNASVSLLSHIRGLQGRHVHLNLIRVGWDAIAAGNQANAREKLDYAVYRTRAIFATRNLGVGRVLYFTIAAAASNFDDIGSTDEADDLSDAWSVPNNGVDVFIVRNISASGNNGFTGRSPVDGDCDKGGKDDGMLGGAINRGGGFAVNAAAWDGFARTLAHEVGHYLGLEHNHDDRPDCPNTLNGCNNLMAQTRCATSCGSGVRVATTLTGNQGSTIRGHCVVRPGC